MIGTHHLRQRRGDFDSRRDGAVCRQLPPGAIVGGLHEKSGAAVNGTWTLRIADDTAGAVGSIRCCSLILYPTTCTPGSGICELCPDVTLNGSLGATSLQQTGRLVRNAVAGTCAAPKSCPGLQDSLTHSYNAHTFRNGPSDACITVSLMGELNGDVFSAAYLGSFDPASLCANYLADCGPSTGAGATYGCIRSTWPRTRYSW